MKRYTYSVIKNANGKRIVTVRLKWWVVLWCELRGLIGI